MSALLVASAASTMIDGGQPRAEFIKFRTFFYSLSIGAILIRHVDEEAIKPFSKHTRGQTNELQKKIATYTACGIAGLALATQALPRHVSIERTAVMNAGPEAVIALAASNTGYQAFNPYKDLDPNLSVEMFGPETGVGSGFAFESKDGAGRQTVASISNDQVVFDLDLGPLGQPTQAISAVAIDGATEVTWSMDMDLGINPVFRVMGLFMDDMIGPNFELGLANIADAAA